MAYVDFFMELHSSTKRDYVARVVEHDKAECAVVAKQYGKDYWDGDRKYGYGGYRYDGRWRPVAQKIAEHYGVDMTKIAPHATTIDYVVAAAGG